METGKQPEKPQETGEQIERLKAALREAAVIVHYGRFHGFKDFDNCNVRECVKWRALLGERVTGGEKQP